MSYQSRKQIILKLLDEKGDVDVKELAQVLETSEITVRRDLGLMAADGLLYRTHGGAMRLSLVNQPISFVQKSAVNADKKDHICRIAAAQIQDGDVIFMDCGSTVFRMCSFIRDKRIKVITNSLPVVHELLNSAVSINLIGGEVDAERQAVHGSMSTEHIRRYQADKAFLGVGGISLDKGLSAVSEKEAEMTLSMAANAQVTYLLCDSSKLGKDKYLTFATLELVNVLITDEQSSEIIQAFTNAGLKVLH
ncbi:DeoR/GlpR family DNA-binding transcription regulator [Runella sp. SP2]|uniref:DeoR/GlpR family DNA-binding transcription regulator n=1 Tax=Runella sp. SP2 TaxID=2268026 RepID=UPI000F086B99|nr:DeoR/GlpR family DNA-binding transcription regulator [Runella sp. SP2]AYQ36289.1 DeoR/GlpR transcriptional regulator [Runella sp. SP2]